MRVEGLKTDVLRYLKDEEIIDLASELIRIPSFTGKETPAAEFMRDFFEDQGFETEVQEVQPGREQVVARLRGDDSGKSMMFNGHLSNV